MSNVNRSVIELRGGVEIDHFKYILDAIHAKLPRVDFEFTIRPDGYIKFGKNLPAKGWTLDEFGRTVGVINDVKFFQRHSNHSLVISNIRDRKIITMMSKANIEKFLDML